MTVQKEFGDFQTPVSLAAQVVDLVNCIFGCPDRIIEPTSGLGSFLNAASSKWGNLCTYEGYEINQEYVNSSSESLSKLNIKVKKQDFFDADWKNILNTNDAQRILVIGNPPWITNSSLGAIDSQNLPDKTNFQGLRGFDAKTGKANFDIAEWMLIRLIEALPQSAAIAMLCKTMTARKVLKHFWKTADGPQSASIFKIDAKVNFNVSVDACLFFALGRKTSEKTASVYSSLSLSSKSSEFGMVDGYLVSDISSYNKFKDIDGGSPYTWRSGVKHDAADIMEFTPVNGYYLNGLGEKVDIEPDYLYPLLKSSDMGNGRANPRRLVLITQKRTGDDTDIIRTTAPKTWAYLNRHEQLLNNRKSSIYNNRTKYSIFGIGDYAFSPWKVGISGLYKSFCFVVIPPQNNRPVMLDDTCYFIPCQSEAEATFLCRLLQSEPCRMFLESLTFLDSKRPVTTEVLRRISFFAVAQRLACADTMKEFMRDCMVPNTDGMQQPYLIMESPSEYKILRRKTKI